MLGVIDVESDHEEDRGEDDDDDDDDVEILEACPRASKRVRVEWDYCHYLSNRIAQNSFPSPLLHPLTSVIPLIQTIVCSEISSSSATNSFCRQQCCMQLTAALG